ncbi:MAG: hypothetical protein Kow0029_09120 [Candidatus Rifleibacteriota bacterium]
MAVTEIIARMYGTGDGKFRQSSSSEKGFDEVLSKTVANGDSDREVCISCGKVSGISESPIRREVESGNIENISANGDAEVSEQDVQNSTAYRFSIFIRTSSDIAGFGEGLIDRFTRATAQFVSALRNEHNYGINILDGYLEQAQTAVRQGQGQTLNFVDSILQAADKGLKAVTASMSSASLLNGFNLSMSGTSALPGTSAADIAGIYLKDSINGGALNFSGTKSIKSAFGSSLRIIKPEELAPPPVKLAADVENSPSVKSRILDKFLQMLDQMTYGNPYLSPDRTGIEFRLAYANAGVMTDDISVTDASEKTAEKMPEDTASEAGEIIA